MKRTVTGLNSLEDNAKTASAAAPNTPSERIRTVFCAVSIPAHPSSISKYRRTVWMVRWAKNGKKPTYNSGHPLIYLES